MRCKFCGFEAKSEPGLKLHRKAKHPTNAEAVERTLVELERLGRMEEIDAAQVQMLRSLARAVDESSDKASLWREYREALGEVLRSDAEASSDLDRALAELRTTSVGD